MFFGGGALELCGALEYEIEIPDEQIFKITGSLVVSDNNVNHQIHVSSSDLSKVSHVPPFERKYAFKLKASLVLLKEETMIEYYAPLEFTIRDECFYRRQTAA